MQRRGEGDHGEGQQGGDRGDAGGDEKERLIGRIRDEILFGQQLDDVGQRLHQAEGTDPVWAVA